MFWFAADPKKHKSSENYVNLSVPAIYKSVGTDFMKEETQGIFLEIFYTMLTMLC